MGPGNKSRITAAVILLRAALLCETDLFRTDESLNLPHPNAALISFW